MAIRKLRGDSRPLYAQAVNALYALVQDGTFRAGAPLPAATETGLPVAMSLNYFVTDCFSFTIDRRIERVSRSTAS